MGNVDGQLCTSSVVLSPLCDIDKWMRRKLCCYHWKQWGRAGYRELRCGVSVREAWHTGSSQMSHHPSISFSPPHETLDKGHH